MRDFTVSDVFPDVKHIRDPLGVHMTLLLGRERALLFDAGYGVLDFHAFIRGITDLPLTLVLSHGHHDHALGAMHFPSSLMLPQDLPVFREYTGRREREKIAVTARLGSEARENYLSASIHEPEKLDAAVFELGGLSVQVIRTPGHTPGSIALYVPKRRLLLLGDNWNPQTWVFFPESLDVRTYSQSFRSLMELPFQTALAPHAEAPLNRASLVCFAQGLNETGFANAKPARIRGYEHIPVKAFEPAPGAMLVFRA